MKKALLLAVSGGLCYLVLSAHSGGTALIASQNRTGSFGSQNDCAGSSCHGANTLDVAITIKLEDLYGNTVNNSRYFPGAFYKITLHGNIFNGTFPKYGFQFTATSQLSNGGAYTPATGLHTVTLGQAIIIEPDNSLSTTAPGNNFSTSFYWQAPGNSTSNPGSWTLYATVLGANDDFSRLGDKANNEQRTLFPVAAGVDEISDKVRIDIYPNPVRDRFSIDMTEAEAGAYTFTILDMHGKRIRQFRQNVAGTTFRTSIDASSWPTGTYFVEVFTGGKRRILRVLRQ